MKRDGGIGSSSYFKSALSNFRNSPPAIERGSVYVMKSISWLENSFTLWMNRSQSLAQYARDDKGVWCSRDRVI